MILVAAQSSLLQITAQVYCCQVILLASQRNIWYMQPDDMADPEEFDKKDTWEDGLTELDRRRHVSEEDEADLIEDEDDSFVDELDEEE